MEPALHAELLSFRSVVGPEADVIQMLSQAFTAALFAAVIDGCMHAHRLEICMVKKGLQQSILLSSQ